MQLFMKNKKKNKKIKYNFSYVMFKYLYVKQHKPPFKFKPNKSVCYIKKRVTLSKHRNIIEKISIRGHFALIL